MKDKIIYFILGISLAVTVWAVWSMLSLNSRVNQLEVFATQVAQLINSSKQAPATK
jgi:hypothetical protein